VHPGGRGDVAYVNPIVAMLLGWLIAGEEFGPRTIVAAAIILSGVALINRASGRPAHEGEGRQPAPAERAPDSQHHVEPLGRH
jgi:hypothetical protein